MIQDSNFEDFLTEKLKSANVNDQNINEIFLTKDSIDLFKMAFIHKSYSKEGNYEYFEFIGDSIVNCCLTIYVTRRFPMIKNPKWTTRIVQNLKKTRYLALLAEECGFFKYIKYGDEITETIKKFGINEKNEKYMSMMEDTFEAFLGCILKVCEQNSLSSPIAYAICQNFIDNLMDPKTISIKYEDVVDSVTRAKELYQSKLTKRRYPQWSSSEASEYMYHTKKTKDDGIDMFEVTMYAWPLGDGTVNYKNRVKIGFGKSNKLKEATSIAAKNGLKVLFEQYSLQEIQDDPYGNKKYIYSYDKTRRRYMLRNFE